MPYRQAAEVPKTEPRPIERLRVSRYSGIPAIALIAGTIALAFFIGWTLYASVHLVCTRASVGATPRCSATQKAGFASPEVKPFDLTESSLSIAEREWDDSKHVVLVTPGGELRGGVEQAFAEATVAGAKRFVSSPHELRWEASTQNALTVALAGLGELAFVVCILFIIKGTHVAIDRDAGVVRVGRRREHRLIEIQSAVFEEIDDSAFHRVRVVKKDGTSHTIAEGRKGDCTALSSALERAVAELAPPPPEPDPKPSDETDETKWERAEALFRTLPLDGCVITRGTESRGLHARGTRRGLEVHVEIDPLFPNGVDIEVKADSKLDEMELHYRPDEKPGAKRPEYVFFGDGLFVDVEEYAAVLRAMPASLRERILTAMTAYDIDTLALWEEETTLGSRYPPNLEDPYARIPAMLDLAVDVAEYASNAPELKPE